VFAPPRSSLLKLAEAQAAEPQAAESDAGTEAAAAGEE
jgi:hypothetical protein